MEPFKQQPRLEAKQGNGSSPRALIRFLLYSSIGAFMFFVPMPINGTSSIMLDHIVTAVRQAFPAIAVLCVACDFSWCALSVLQGDMAADKDKFAFVCFSTCWFSDYCHGAIRHRPTMDVGRGHGPISF